MRQRATSGSPYEPSIGFSRGARQDRIIAISGTAPVGPNGQTVEPGDPAAQTLRCLTIVREALETLGGSLDDVIRTRIYITRREDWEAVGQAHGEFFGDIRPASTMVLVAGLLDPEWRVELEADAVLPNED